MSLRQHFDRLAAAGHIDEAPSVVTFPPSRDRALISFTKVAGDDASLSQTIEKRERLLQIAKGSLLEQGLADVQLEIEIW